MKSNTEITDVRIVKMKDKGNLLGYANIVINNHIALKGIKIIETQDGERFIAMPGRKNTRTDAPKYYSNFHPISRDVLETFKTTILEAFDNMQEE